MKLKGLVSSLSLLCLSPLVWAQVTLPFAEPMDSAGIPQRESMTLSSLQQGRMQMVQGETEEVGLTAAITSTSGGNRFRGNIYEIFEDTYLFAHDFYLNRASPTSIQFAVYEAAAFAGPYSRVNFSSKLVEAGEGYVTSGELFVPLEAGKFYIIGAGWSGDTGYGYNNSGANENVGFGTLVSGYVNNNSATPDDPSSVSASTTRYRQRLRTGALVEENFPPPGTNSTASSSGIFRGQKYRVDRDTYLMTHQMLLNRGQEVNTRFMVFQSDSEDGTYTRISDHPVVASVGSGYVSYNPGLLLEAGRYYIVGTYWNESLAYSYRVNAFSSPADTDFGQALGGVQASSLPEQELVFTDTSTGYVQKLFTIQPSALRMDSAVEGQSGTNLVSMELDLNGVATATLRFMHRAMNESSGIDVVSLFDADGQPHQLLDLPDGTTDWELFSIDVADFAIQNSLNVSAPVSVVIQQSDDGVWPSAGREIRELHLDVPPDVAALSQAVQATKYTFRGFDSPKVIPLSQEIQYLGGSDNLFFETVTFQYGIDLNPGSFTQTEEVELNILKGSSQQQTRVFNLTIPASTKLPLTLYATSVILDSLDTLAEFKEGNNSANGAFFVNHYSGVLWFNGVETSIEITDWDWRTILSSTDHLISGTGTVNGREFAFADLAVVKDLDSLDYTVDATEAQIILLDPLEEQQIQGVRYRSSGGLNLSKDGLFADLVVTLPAGLGWAADADRMDLNGTLSFQNTALTASFEPVGPLTKNNAAWIAEETKPIMMEIQSLIWTPNTGDFLFVSTGNVEFVREGALQNLEDDALNGLIPADHGARKSNSQYYRYADLGVGDEILVETGTGGEAMLTVDLQIKKGDFLAHMPYNSQISWNGDGLVKVVQDHITAGSFLKTVDPLSVPYNQNCPDGCPDADKNTLLTLANPADFRFTPQGGLVTEGDLDQASILGWGALPEGQGLPEFAQRSGAFTTAAFFATGHFYRGEGGPAFYGVNTPGWLLNLASGWDDASEVIDATMPEFYEGDGRYAGLNFRMNEHPGAEGYNVLGGVAWDPFPLSDRSKYYVRHSGVTGIHEAEVFDFSGSIYGYNFKFTNLGFSYLSSSPVVGGSRTNGNLTFDKPIDDVIYFNELQASCKGELGAAEPAEGNELITLAYWNLDYGLYQLEFRRENGCDIGTGTLVTTGSSDIELIVPPMFGELALGPDNMILPSTKNDIGVESRFTVPASIEVAGRDEQLYSFVPVHLAYLNDYESADAAYTDMGKGYFSLAGSLDVPFFDALKTQLHFTSGEGVLYQMGGWPDEGWKDAEGKNFFTVNHLFDAGHVSWPKTNVASLDEYRSTTLTAYQPAVHKTIAGLVEVRYPLKWDSATRSFASPKTQKSTWLATELEHQVDYMDAEDIELSFGLKYDGLPRLNLTNFVFNELDDQLGIAQGIIDAGADEVMGFLEGGIRSIDRLLKPVSGNVAEPLIEKLAGGPLRDFYHQLHAEYAAVEDEAVVYNWFVLEPIANGEVLDQLKADLEHQIRQYFLEGLTDVNPSESVTGYFDRLVGEIDSAIAAVDAMTPERPSLPGVDDLPVSQIIPDDSFLYQNANGDYLLLGDLTRELISTFAGELTDGVDAVTGDAIDEALAELNRPLQAVSEELGLVKVELLELRQALVDAEGEFKQELLSLVPSIDELGVTDSIEVWADDAAEAVIDYLRTLPPDRNPLYDYNPDQWVDMLKDEVVIEFLDSRFHHQVTTALRARLYDVDGRFRKAVDSAFASINSGMRELLSDALTEIDDSVNEFAGNLDSYVGAGQLDGYAQIRGDSLERMRIDGKFVWKVPDDMEFKGFLLIEKLPLSANPICNPGVGFGEYATARKVTVGALELPCSFSKSDLLVNISTYMSFSSLPDVPFPVPVGLGGQFWLSEYSDPIVFEEFALTDLGAAVAFGKTEGYIAGMATGTFNAAEVSAGMFFGATCNLDPLLMVDPEVGNLLGEPPLIGGYVYGEGWVPVVDYGCGLRLSAGVGAGIFFFSDTDNPPTYGMKVLLGAGGEAICLVSVRGEVRMVGMRRAGRFVAEGRGEISGTVGDCDWVCFRFRKMATVTYDDGDLDVSY